MDMVYMHNMYMCMFLCFGDNLCFFHAPVSHPRDLGRVEFHVGPRPRTVEHAHGAGAAWAAGWVIHSVDLAILLEGGHSGGGEEEEEEAGSS